MDLRYLRLAFLLGLLFLKENSCSREMYYRCTYRKELFLVPLDEGDCEGMICWHSQMQDMTRLLLTQEYNDYRREIAKGICSSCSIREKYQYMSEMTWHWVLEKKALELLRERRCDYLSRTSDLNLSAEEMFTSQTDELGERFLRTKFFEYSTTSFLLDETVSSEQGSYVKQFLIYLRSREMNILQDWATHFRRQFVTFFGCSMAVVKVKKARQLVHTALNEKIKNGSRVLHVICVFASPVGKIFVDPSNKGTSNRAPTMESCRWMNSSKNEIDVEDDLCSFRDPTNEKATYTPCQLYYPHTHFHDSFLCPQKIPHHWKRYQRLADSDYKYIAARFPGGVTHTFAISSMEESGTMLAHNAVDEYSRTSAKSTSLQKQRITTTTATSISEELASDDKSFQVEITLKQPMPEMSFEKKYEAVMRFQKVDSTDDFDLFDPFSLIVPEPLPPKPKKQMLYLRPELITSPYDRKYCVVVALFYFIVVAALLLLLSTMAKYHAERRYFETLPSPTK